jgi:epoxyqueuosine reductase
VTDTAQDPTRDRTRDPASAAGRASRLAAWALEAGFDRAGVAGVEPLERGGVFLRWLGDGRQAGMGWLENRVEERLEPERVLPGARSVLCVALGYHPVAGEPEPAGDLWPGVARYAHGRDYHNLMGKRLKKLARRVREAFPGCGTRAYVDTGPVLERELAARAGLGVVGKNTCLLSRRGSWFLLGELFLTLELEPAAAPLSDLCGGCTRCLDACPTGAFPAPYELDSRRCISYWTIEHRGAVPAEWRPRMGEWVFGCDVCQQVCPWNQGPSTRPLRPVEEPDLRLPPRRRTLDLAALLGLDGEGYRERFRGSALQRARLEGLKRNAATVMGNRGEARYVAPLARALAQEPDTAVRRHAAWALGEIGGAAAERVLGAARERETDPAVLTEIRAALRRAELRGVAGSGAEKTTSLEEIGEGEHGS